MKAYELNNATSGLKDLEEAQKASILKIIDMQTEDNTQKILDKIDARFNRVDTQFNKVNARLDKMQNKVNAQFNKVDKQFNGVNAQFNRVNAQFNKVDTQLNKMQNNFNGLEHKVEHKLDIQQKLIWGVLIVLFFAIVSFMLKN